MKADATNTQAWLEIGLTYYRSEEFSNVVVPIQNVISMEPTNYQANLWLGFTYYHLKNFQAAAAVLKTAAQCKPDEAEVHHWLGQTLCDLGRFPEAVEAYKKALDVATNKATAWFALGTCYYRQGSYQAAVESFQQSVSTDTNYLALLWLAYTFEQMDRVEEAANSFGQLVARSPHDYEANLGRGMTLLRLARWGEATPSFERALESKPGGLLPRWGLFLSYLATGQLAKISRLRLGVLPVVLSFLLALYLTATILLFRQSLRLATRSSPSLGLAVAWCGATLSGQTLILGLLAMIFSWSALQALGLSIGLSSLPLISAALLGFARQPWGEPFVWPPRVPDVKLLLTAFLAFGGSLLFESGYTNLVERFTGKPMPVQMIVSWLSADVHSPWLTFIGVALLAPVGEEILFRGLLYGAIRERLSCGWTVIVTAALFAFVHLEPSYFVPVFVTGLVLGWARQKSGGLALPIMLHCLNNGCAFLIVMDHSRH